MSKSSTTHEIGTKEAMVSAVEAEKRDERKVSRMVRPLPVAESEGPGKRRDCRSVEIE